MEIRVNITKTKLFVLIISIFALAGMIFAFAYNSSGTGGNPAIMGHSADEIDWSKQIQGNVSATGFCLNGNCINSWPSTTSYSYKLVFDSSATHQSTWTVPAGVTSVRIIVIGGGGAGGNCVYGLWNKGGGGGSGGLSKSVISVTPGQVYNFKVGSGGVQVTNSGGSIGGDSNFTGNGVSIIAHGGHGGTTGSGVGGVGSGGLGGSLGSGQNTIVGLTGYSAVDLGGSAGISGDGAPSVLGYMGGIGSSLCSGCNNNVQPIAPTEGGGAGGAGSTATQYSSCLSATNGADGMVIIEF